MNTNIKRFIQVAKGDKRADLVLKGGTVVDVIRGKQFVADVAIVEDTIVGVGSYRGKTEIDCSGKFVVPGFVDTHTHIESSMLRPSQYVASVVKCGTTTIFLNPYEIANVCGKTGMDFVIEELKKQPIEAFLMAPSCVPTTRYESGGAKISSRDIGKMFKSQKFFGLGEFVNFEDLINLDKECIAKVEQAKSYDKLIDGSICCNDTKICDAYFAAGIRTNNKILDVQQMDDCIARGVYAQLRLGSICKELRDLVKGINTQNCRRCVFCSDNKLALDLQNYGHINHNIRECVAGNLDVYSALMMATINAAECYGRTNVGLICAGYIANIAVVDDLTNWKVQTTVCKGKVVFDRGQLQYQPIDLKFDQIKSFNVKPVLSSMYKFGIDRDKYKADCINANIIKVLGSLNTQIERCKIDIDKDGDLILPTDVCKIAVIERYDATGNVGLGLLKGIGLIKGAIAQSISHDSHNIVVIGKTAVDMTIAVDTLIKSGGGIVAVVDGVIKENFALPIGGIMSDMDAEYVASRQVAMVAKLKDFVSFDQDLVGTLSFITLPTLPSHRMTDLGLFDVVAKKFVKVLEL